MGDHRGPLVTPPLYLDHAATTPLAPAALEAMLPFLQRDFGNPSSVHAAGRVARAAVDDARDRLAEVLGCEPREIVFTASGSEADNLALRGALQRWGRDRGTHVVVSAIEHDAVLATAQQLSDVGGATVTVVPCDARGIVDPDAFAAAVRPDTVVASLMLVNNETGVVQDVAAAAEAVRRRNPATLVHTDAVQALGRLRLRPRDLGVDLLSLSAHKAYGPKGVGALWVRHGVFLGGQVTGGGQERGRRSGTENVAGIAGFGAAASMAEELREAEGQRQEELARRLTRAAVSALPDAVVTGDGAPRAPGFAGFAFPGCRTDLLLAVLDAAGIAASGGSACSSGAPTPSHVLLAMGLDPALATGALRCTLGRSTSADDVDRAAAAIAAAVRQVRSAAPAAVLGGG
ncbi:MAG: cysteine desulfurase [Candidatus Dormibacteraeota bacterium]|nr:cysteine desulfurase [Candidatus Dormibacteraeota bacterium]MBV9525976.1 cysteine desulfurase [Candidatus Dormibacteraeota bacterium]